VSVLHWECDAVLEMKKVGARFDVGGVCCWWGQGSSQMRGDELSALGRGWGSRACYGMPVMLTGMVAWPQKTFGMN
jgi:hypothetical protein